MNEKFAKIREELAKSNAENEQEKEIIDITIQARKNGKTWKDIVKAFDSAGIILSAGQLRYKLKKLEQN